MKSSIDSLKDEIRNIDVKIGIISCFVFNNQLNIQEDKSIEINDDISLEVIS